MADDGSEEAELRRCIRRESARRSGAEEERRGLALRLQPALAREERLRLEGGRRAAARLPEGAAEEEGARLLAEEVSALAAAGAAIESVRVQLHQSSIV